MVRLQSRRFAVWLTAFLWLAAALVAHPTHAQQGRRAGFPPSYRPGLFLPQVAVNSYCNATVGGVAPDICADFTNGVYTVGSTTYPSFTAMGGTLPAGCTIVLGSGLQCASGSGATYPSFNNAVSGYAIYTRFSAPSDSTTVPSDLQNGSTYGIQVVSQSGGTIQGAPNGGSASAQSSGNSGGVFSYLSSGTAGRTSIFGNATTSFTSTSLAAGQTFAIANQTATATGLAITAPYYVQAVARFTGTFTDAQVQAGAQIAATTKSTLALTGDCAKTPPTGLTMTACYDFANGSYTSDGMTAQSSFTAAGGTLSAGCTITAGSGLSCSGTSFASSSTNIGVSGYFFVAKSLNSAAGNVVNAVLGTGGPGIGGAATAQYWNGTSEFIQAGNGNTSASSASGTQQAACPTAASAGFLSANGQTAVSTTDSFAGATSTLYMGNNSSGNLPNGTGYLKSVRLFTGTCNATNVQAASAN